MKKHLNCIRKPIHFLKIQQVVNDSKTSLELNMSYSHSFIDTKKAKKEIQDAIKKFESKDLEKFVKEGTKKRIEEVRERLKAL